MRRRAHRRNLVVWSSSGVAGGGRGDLRSTRTTRARRTWRIRRWLRVGALLMVIAVMRLARLTKSGWEPVSLAVGLLLTVSGFVVPWVAGAYLGLLVLTVALLLGIRRQGGGNPAA